MSELLDNLPWGKIGAGVGSALLVLVGGGAYKGSVDQKIQTANAPASLQQEHISRHWNWAVDCPVIAESPEHGLEVRRCPDDRCLMPIVRRGGTTTTFFIVAPSEIAPPPVVIGELEQPDPWSGVAYAQSCLSLEQHGPPNHPKAPYIYGEDLGGGWLWLYGVWVDGCRYRWKFHPASRSQAGGEWFVCAAH